MEIDIPTQHLLLGIDGSLNHHCTFLNREIVGGLRELMGLTQETFAITHPTQEPPGLGDSWQSGERRVQSLD